MVKREGGGGVETSRIVGCGARGSQPYLRSRTHGRCSTFVSRAPLPWLSIVCVCVCVGRREHTHTDTGGGERERERIHACRVEWDIMTSTGSHQGLIRESRS